MVNRGASAALEPTAFRAPSKAQKPIQSSISKKGERSRSGCITCRARKVKCDEQPGACLNCERLGVECAGYSSGPLSKSMRTHLRNKRPDPNFTEAGLERKRLRESCKSCRTSKTRCSGDRPACTRCHERGFKCHYEPQKSPSSNSSVHDASERAPYVLGNVPDALDDSSTGNLHITLAESVATPQAGSFIESHDGVVPANTLLPHWLFYKTLPSRAHIYQLIDAYFTHIHPLRCFAFIHRPSFMEKFDQDLTVGGPGSSLLLVLCALGAKFYAITSSSYDEHFDSKNVLLAGTQWARLAQREIFEDINHISIENLMATIVLYDHELRVGNYASAFMLSGTAARMSQALQINLEYSTDILCAQPSSRLSFCARESRRRLMWSCYVMDSWVGSGVDQLTMINDKDIKIQLPCNDRNFLQQIPSITETVMEGHFLPFIPENLRPDNANHNMGMMAQFVRVAETRKKVLTYLKTIDISQPPNLPDEHFTHLETSFLKWHDHLPITQRLTSSSIYTRKDSGQLGALFLMHFTYHISLCDLYRLAMPMLLPGLLKNWSSVKLSPEQQEFRLQYQRKCFEHAKTVAQIFGKCIEHGRLTLTDTWLPTCAFESIRTMLYYGIEGLGQNSDQKEDLISEIIPLCRANMQCLKMMIPLFATAEHCYITATSLIRKAGLGPQLIKGASLTNMGAQAGPSETSVDRNSPASESPEHVLNPLSIYALTRQNIDGKEQDNVLSSMSIQGMNSAAPLSTTSLCDSDYQQRSLPARHQPIIPLPSSLPPLQYTVDSMPNVTSIPNNSYLTNVPTMWPQPEISLNMNPFWTNFTSDFDGSWMPAETLQENALTRGMPPWANGMPDEQFPGNVI